MFRTMRGLKLVTLAFAAVSLCAPAAIASTKSAAKPAAQTAPAPALWKIQNGKSTVYLLGSIHILPKDFQWHTPVIDKAIDAADVFYFEASLSHDLQEINYFYQKNGYLPRGQTLHSKLSPEALAKYKQLISDLHIDPDKIDYLQPWNASEMLSGAYAGHQLKDQKFTSGVDVSLMKYALEHKKQLAYLETVEEHWAILPTIDQGQEIPAFEKMLKNLDEDTKIVQPMIMAWSHGDLTAIGSLGDQDAVEKEALLYKRNANWIPKIETMLKDNKTYLVTAGVAHFSGKGSVIDRLCSKGWNVERIQTGSVSVPAACDVGSLLRVSSLR